MSIQRPQQALIAARRHTKLRAAGAHAPPPRILHALLRHDRTVHTSGAAAATSSVELPPDGASASAAAAAPNQLVLFSVIVALSPARGYSRTFRDGDDARHQRHQHRSQSPPKLRRR